jgi:CheY-like chemotaxis protein
MPSTVFIVDDEKNIRRTVRMVLEGEGYSVEEASSGEEALARIAEIAADVVLLDVQLPDLNGVQAAGRIAALEGDSAIVLTSSRDQSDLIAAPVDGAARGFIPKSELSGAAIRKLLG